MKLCQGNILTTYGCDRSGVSSFYSRGPDLSERIHTLWLYYSKLYNQKIK